VRVVDGVESAAEDADHLYIPQWIVFYYRVVKKSLHTL
jgi:hypothetical protein